MARKSRTPPVTFLTWLNRSQPGERLTYHIASAKPDDRLFTAAWDAHLEGKVALFQERDDRGVLHYLAERISVRGARFLKNVHRLAVPHVPINERFPRAHSTVPA